MTDCNTEHIFHEKLPPFFVVFYDYETLPLRARAVLNIVLPQWCAWKLHILTQESPYCSNDHRINRELKHRCLWLKSQDTRLRHFARIITVPLPPSPGAVSETLCTAEQVCDNLQLTTAGGKGGHGCLLSFSTEIDWGGTKSRRTALDMGFPKVRIQNVNFDVKYIYLSVKLSKLGYIPETPRRRLVAPQATAPWIATGFVFALRGRAATARARAGPSNSIQGKIKTFYMTTNQFFFVPCWSHYCPRQSLKVSPRLVQPYGSL